MDSRSTIRSKVGVALAVLLSHATATALIAQQPLPVSKGVYRLPYADSTDVRITFAHLAHTPPNRIDMIGLGSGPFTVVAAAAGWIRQIVDTNDTACPDACPATMTTPENDCDGSGTTTTCDHCQAQNSACAGYSGPSANCCERHVPAGMNCAFCPFTPAACTCPGNNYVWIEHSNGEWSKYTHLRRGDPTANGRFVGEFVAAGTPLGREGDVGFASGPHLHFEVAVPRYVELAPSDPLNPTDPDSPPDTEADWFTTGFLCDDECGCGSGGTCSTDFVCGCAATNVNRQNRIPVFCGVGIAIGGEEYTADPCNDLCDDPNVSDVSGLTIAGGSLPFYNQVEDTVGNPAGEFVVESFAGAALRAGTRVTLSPGFHAELGSYFSASIGACDTPGGTGE